MKTIKRTNLFYRLVIFVMEMEPKTTCTFYLDAFISLLCFPFVGYLELIMKIENLTISEKNKWQTLGMKFGLLFLFWIFAVLIDCIVLILIQFITGKGAASDE